jgi:hypothetical protein
MVRSFRPALRSSEDPGGHGHSELPASATRLPLPDELSSRRPYRPLIEIHPTIHRSPVCDRLINKTACGTMIDHAPDAVNSSFPRATLPVRTEGIPEPAISNSSPDSFISPPPLPDDLTPDRAPCLRSRRRSTPGIATDRIRLGRSRYQLLDLRVLRPEIAQNLRLLQGFPRLP